MRLKLDLHVHTTRSHDAFTQSQEIPSICRELGLDGIAITDHNQPAVALPREIIALPGIEVSSRDGHIIGLGVNASVSRGLSGDETIQEIHKLGGMAIIPHPYDLLRSSIKPDLLTVRPDAIEVMNAASFLHSLSWKKAKAFGQAHLLPAVAGSDSHIPQTVGRSYTLVEADSKNAESILEAVRAGRTSPVGRPIRMTERLRKLVLQLTRSP